MAEITVWRPDDGRRRSILPRRLWQRQARMRTAWKLTAGSLHDFRGCWGS